MHKKVRLRPEADLMIRSSGRRNKFFFLILGILLNFFQKHFWDSMTLGQNMQPLGEYKKRIKIEKIQLNVQKKMLCYNSFLKKELTDKIVFVIFQSNTAN